MHFAYPLPWWLAVAIAAAIAAAAFAEYRRPLAPLTVLQRGALASLRVLTLAALALFLFRPIAILPPVGSRDAIVPVLVDVSRSMRLGDADGQTRIARAAALLKAQLMPALATHFTTELYTVGDGLAAANLDRLNADARRTDLTGARRRNRRAVRRRRHGRHRGRRVGSRKGWRRKGGRVAGRRSAGVCRRRRIARRSARS